MDNKPPPQPQVPVEELVAWLRRLSRRLAEIEEACRDMTSQVNRRLNWLGATDWRPAHVARRRTFRINGKRVELPNLLAKLVDALSASPGTWLTAEQLSLKTGGTVTGRTRRRISQLVYRLRNELKRAGIEERMIETSRRYGFRWKGGNRGDKV